MKVIYWTYSQYVQETIKKKATFPPSHSTRNLTCTVAWKTAKSYQNIQHILHQGKSSIKEKPSWIYVTWSTDSFLKKYTQVLHRFTTEQNYVQKSRGIITTDWLLYYDMYCKQCRYPRCTYGKKIFSARYWEDATAKCKSYPISFSRTFNSNLSVPSQF